MQVTKKAWLINQLLSTLDEDEKVVTVTGLHIPDSYSDEEVEECLNTIHEWISQCKAIPNCNIREYCEEKLKELQGG